MARPRVVLFDVDQTLLDFDKAERAALRQALRSLGLPCPPESVATYQRINAELWAAFRRGETTQRALARERFRRLLRETGGKTRFASELGERYLDALSTRGDRLPGCRPTLLTLRRRFRLGVVTNGIDRVQRARLAASRLAPLFDVIVTSQSCGYAKPDPRILQVALKTLRARADEAVYVGDDPATDGAAARAAGVRFIWMDGRGAGGAVAGRRGSGRARGRIAALCELASVL